MAAKDSKQTREKLADYVRRVRQQAGLSTYDVQERSGGAISQSHVSQIENNEKLSPSVGQLAALARGLGVPPLELCAVAIGERADSVPDYRAQRLEALFYGVDELDPELQKEIDVAIRFMETAVEAYKKKEKKPRK